MPTTSIAQLLLTARRNVALRLAAFNPDQPRDERGQWTSGDGGASSHPLSNGHALVDTSNPAFPDSPAFDFKNAQGEKVGSIDLVTYPDIGLTIHGVSIYTDVAHSARGLGLARQAIDVLVRKYGRLSSDPQGNTSADAHKMWRAVGGRKIETDKNTARFYWTKTRDDLRSAAARKSPTPLHRVADLAVPPFRRAIKSAFSGAGVVSESTALVAAELNGARLREAVTPLISRVLNAAGQVAARNFKEPRRLAGVEPRVLLRPPVAGMKFDVANPKAVAWARNRGSALVTSIVEETRRTIRRIVADGIEQGRTIKQTGRILRSIVGFGLTEQQSQSIVKLYDKLEEQGYDDADIDDELNAESTRLLNDRADTISHHETMLASNRGQEELWDQAVENGYLTGLEVREWIVTPDDRLCDLCAPMEGRQAALGGTWTTDDGTEVETPQDLHVNCRCTEGLVMPEHRQAEQARVPAGSPEGGQFASGDALAANGLSVDVWDSTKSKQLFADRVVGINKGGKSVGYISLRKSDDPDYLQVSTIVVDSGLRGKGIGAALLVKAATIAKDDGYLGIVASSQQTDDAKRMWAGLIKKGVASIGGTGRPILRGAGEWDESQHPRDEVGKFADVGGGPAGSPGAGSAEAYEAELQQQSAHGIQACERVLDQAVRDATYAETSGPQDWESVSSDDKQAVLEHWYEDEEERLREQMDDSDVIRDVRSSLADDLHGDDAFIDSVDAPFIDAMRKEGIEVNPESIAVDTPAYGNTYLNSGDLKRADGADMTTEDRQTAEKVYERVYGEMVESKVDELMEEESNKEKVWTQMDEAVSEAANENWQYMSGSQRFNYAKENDLLSDSVEVTPGLPTHWKSGAGEVDDKTAQNDEDYARTSAIVREMAAIRTGEIAAERGYPNAGDKVGRTVAEEVWSEWKDSSTSNLGLALQLAAARELGGVHRLKPEEIERANAAAAGLWRESLHPRDADGHFIDVLTGGRMQDKEAAFTGVIAKEQREKVGMDVLQSYVRAQWETSQFVLAQEGKERLEVYRAIILDKTVTDAATHEIVEDSVRPPMHHPDGTIIEGTGVLHGTRLPDLRVLRSGAQSTSSVRSVANSWRGVGGVRITPTTERIILRVSAPRTAVLSLPVFGSNVTEEREVVLAGTKGAWHWDAWQGRAPAFKTVPVHVPAPVHRGAAQAWVQHGGTLVIDLLEIDRAANTHWLNGPHDAALERRRERKEQERAQRAQLKVRHSGEWNEADHPRDPDGKFGDGGGGKGEGKFGKAKIGRMKVLTDKALREAWGKTFGEASTDEIADKMLVAIPGAKKDWTVEIMASQEGAITFRARNDVLTVTREFSPDGTTVHHELLDVKYGKQAAGLTNDLIERQFEFYKEHGIKEVTTTANLNVGGYAWARAGFLPDNPALMGRQVADRVAFLHSQKLITDAESHTLYSHASALAKDPTEIWRIADLRDQRIAPKAWGLEGKQPLGKLLLLHTTWEGRAVVADATNPDTKQGARFAAYFKRH